MRYLFIIIKTVLILILCESIVTGTTYYIDASKGNDYNSGTTPLRAWKSLNKLNNSWHLINPGDSILFKRGQIWRPTSNNEGLIKFPWASEGGLHGTAYSPIVIGAYGLGNKPILSTGGSSSVRAVRGQDISFITIQDIEFRGEMLFHGTLKVSSSKISHIKLLAITLDGNALGDCTRGNLVFYAPAIQVAPEVWKQSQMDNIEIGNCLIRNTSGAGIQLYGQGNNWIYNNQIYNTEGGGINFAEGDSNIVEYNTILNTRGPGIKLSVHSHTSNGLIIRGNLIVNTGKSGIAAYNLINAKIYNNTISSCGSQTAIFGWTTQVPPPMCSKGKTGFDNNYIINNIFFGGSLFIWKADGVTIKYPNDTSIIYSQNNIWDDNFFTNNIIYNPRSENQIYFRSFTEVPNIMRDSSGEFESSTFSWESYGNNIIEVSKNEVFAGNGSLRISYVDHWAGAFLYLEKISDLVRDLRIGEKYRVSFWGKKDSGDVSVTISGGGIFPKPSVKLTTEWEYYEIIFTATAEVEHIIRLSTENFWRNVYIDNLEVEVLINNTLQLDESWYTELREKYYNPNLAFTDYDWTKKDFQTFWNKNINFEGNINSNPLFIDERWLSSENYGDYHLSASSPGISAGVKIPEYTRDLFGNKINPIQNPDIGAIQTSEYAIPDSNYFNVSGDNDSNKRSENPIDIDSLQKMNQYKLYQNYPNPFNPETTITYYLPNESYVSIAIYNIIGQLIDNPVNSIKMPGNHKFNWGNNNLANGIYIVEFTAKSQDGTANSRIIQKILFLK